MIRRRGAELLGVLAVFILLTAAMTWPQVLSLSTRATPHHDVYFNMWRLRWFAHALVTPSTPLFDGNIFYPERSTLALSDAMLVEGAIAAPLVWARVPPVLVHNLLLLGAIVMSGAAMYALARYLTGSRAAGVLAGVVFAFAPYRVEHLMHMELQWAMWAPLAFLALHRTLDTGQWKYGIATGACLALQMLSSIYYGIFLASLIGMAALLLLARDRGVPLRAVAGPLAAAAVLAAGISAAYAIPYGRAHARVGDRSPIDVAAFSARPSSYLAATPGNWLYGGTAAARVGPERRLFPGAIPAVLALVGLLLQVPSRRAIVYLLLLVAAFEASLGLRGYSYTFLYDHVAAYRVLRATARLGMFVLLFVGVLAGYGYQALARGRSAALRAVLAGVLTAGILVEYRAVFPLTVYPNIAPPVYRVLAHQPVGIVAEFPVPRPNTLPGDEAEYAFMSTFHWFPIVNGYSGNYPPSFIERLDRVDDFPGPRSMAQLRKDHVAYVIVHGSAYSAAAFGEIRTRIAAGDALVELGAFDDSDGPAVLYRFR